VEAAVTGALLWLAAPRAAPADVANFAAVVAAAQPWFLHVAEGALMACVPASQRAAAAAAAAAIKGSTVTDEVVALRVPREGSGSAQRVAAHLQQLRHSPLFLHCALEDAAALVFTTRRHLLPLASLLETLLTSEYQDAASTSTSTSTSASASAPAPSHAHAHGHDDDEAEGSGATREQIEAAAAEQYAATRRAVREGFWWARHRGALLVFAERTARAESGEAALFVYSKEECERSVAALRGLRNVSRVLYAMKANWNEELLRLFHAAGLGFECVSLEEVARVRALFPALPADRILFTPNFAARREYEHGFAMGCTVTLDNDWPLTAWPDVFRGRDVFVRIDPGQGRGHHAHVRTGGARSKFGVSVQQLLELPAVTAALGVRVTGFHIHAGSGVFEAASWAANARLMASLLEYFPAVRVFDVGGGLGVPYRPAQPPLDLAALDTALGELRALRPDVEVWLEPGRFLVAQSGVLLARVTQLKQKPGKRFVGVAAGMNALIRPALYDAYHHIENLSRLDSDEAPLVADVVGPICETGDVLGRDRALPRSTSEGDWVVVATAGAYGRCMSSDYNLRAPPREVLFVEAAHK
jgi:diaminopimelate decarboxylase